MSRRRPPTSTTVPGSDFRQVLFGLAGLAVLGLSFGGALSAYQMDGRPVGEPSLRETPLVAAGDLQQAAAAPQRNLPVPRAAGGFTAQPPVAAVPRAVPAHPEDRNPEPVAAAAGRPVPAALPAAPEPVTAVAAGAHPQVRAAGPAPAPTAPAALPSGPVPQPKPARHDIAPHRLEADAGPPFQLASLFLRPDTGTGDRSWRRAVDLLEAFGNAGYDLRRIRAGKGDVPRIFVAALPEDMRSIRLAEQRKRTFIKSVLPLVLRANDAVLAERRRLRAILAEQAAGRGPSAWQQAWLAEMAERYGSASTDAKALLTRVDIVPVSLALAQAAEESGWGTSRFARQGNAVFGQWTWDTEIGIVPRDRPRGRYHLVRKFPALQHSVTAYVANLNSNPAYAAFREARARQRSKGEVPAGIALAAHLTAYSERGTAYVRTLRRIIGQNALQDLDDARLSESVTGWTARLAGGALRSVF